jgi:hypothetical protein
MHGRIIRCSGGILLPIGKYYYESGWSDSMVHRQRHVGNIRSWSKEMGAICFAVYLHGAEYFRGVECFYGRGDMINISEESNMPWWIVLPCWAILFGLVMAAISGVVTYFWVNFK